MMKIILASSSITRYQLLQRLQIPFSTQNPEVDETPHHNEIASHLAARLARCKALTVAKQQPNAVVIASDQTCEIGHNILGKPLTQAKAIQQLSLASGQTALFYTALAIYHPTIEELMLHLDLTRVHFRTLREPEILNYVQREDVLHCAGSFKCEGLGITLFNKIEQQDPTALLGLPLIALNHSLIKLGINPLLPKDAMAIDANSE